MDIIGSGKQMSICKDGGILVCFIAKQMMNFEKVATNDREGMLSCPICPNGARSPIDIGVWTYSKGIGLGFGIDIVL
jgi:hypothetical protein